MAQTTDLFVAYVMQVVAACTGNHFRSLVAELADRCTLGSAKSREVCTRRRPFSNPMDQSENLPETRERCGRCGGTGTGPPPPKRPRHPSSPETAQDSPKRLDNAEALATPFLHRP